MSEAEKKEKTAPGMVARRVDMPVGLWTEVLELAKRGGADHRDVLLSLLDLGLQAQSEDVLKPRLVAVDSKVWERVQRAAFPDTVSDQEALAYLVDLGLQARASKEAVALPAEEPAGTPVQIDLLNEDGAVSGRLTTTHMDQVPVAGEALVIGGSSYAVRQRAWALRPNGKHAVYLRVEPFGA